MKKIIGVIACGLFLNAAAASSQVTDKEKVQMEKRIEKLIKKMTLEEKVGLLHGNSKFYVAGVERLGIPEWSLSDGPHGVRAEINRHDWAYAGWTNDSASYFPTGTAFAAAWNPELAYRRGEVLGEEARWRKKDVLLGPGVNIIRSPLCGRNFEYMSEDPYMNSVLAVAYIKGLQSRDVACSVKHFAVNNQETNRTTVDVECSERALREIYLPAFKAAVQEGGALTVMAAYNKFRGEFCAENNYLVRKILRNEWGFDGVYVTDWGAAHSTVPSMEAGLDLEMGTLIDKYEDKLGTYLMQLNMHDLTPEQSKQTAKFLHTISDFERLGDHAVNISRVAQELHEKSRIFSDAAKYELHVLESALKELLDLTINSFVDEDLVNAAKVEPLRELIGILCNDLKMRHIKRLRNGQCDLNTGFAFNDLLTNYDRIAAHCSNIAVAILELDSSNFDMHEYTKSVRKLKDNNYVSTFDYYEQKYNINGYQPEAEQDTKAAAKNPVKAVEAKK